ncbi:hypothetical protein HDU93_009628 [Gonapodya sp. JEL0774]|nr:hypothetical protein HDU93_009628 [Gonapodya sp. JEL0774]
MPPKVDKKPKKQSAAEKARELEEQRKREEDGGLFAVPIPIRWFQHTGSALKLDKEQATFEAESQEIKRILDTKTAELTSLENSIRAKAEWQSFQDCSHLPNPASDREMNTYLSHYREEPVVCGEKTNLHSVTDRLGEIEELCSVLENEISMALDLGNEKQVDRLLDHLWSTRKEPNRKWELITAHVLQILVLNNQHMDLFSPGQGPNENFHLTNVTKGYKLAIWSNLTRNPRHKTLDFSELSISATLPKPIILSNLAIRFLHETSGTVAPMYDLYQSPGQHWSVIGGVLNLDLVELPDSPHVVNNWTVRQSMERSPTEVVEDSQNGDEGVTAGQWAISLSFRIPASCFVSKDKAKVMWWDDSARKWREDGIEQTDIELESGIVKFRTTNFKPTAVVQDAFLEYPLEDWQIRPTASANHAILTVRGRFNEIEIEIGEGECRLLKPRIIRSGRAELAGLDNEAWFQPSILLHKMSRLGLAFIGPRTMKGVDLDVLKLKNPIGEDIMASGISICCPAYEFRRSPDNSSLSVNRCAIQFRQLNSQGIPVMADIPAPAEMPDFQLQMASPEQAPEGVSRKSTPTLAKSTASISKNKSKGDVSKDGKTKSRASSPDRDSAAKSAGRQADTKGETGVVSSDPVSGSEGSSGEAQLPELPKAIEVPWNHIVVDASYKVDDGQELTIAFASPKDRLADDIKFAIKEGQSTIY